MAISPYSREQLVAMLADVDKAKAVAVQAERALDIPGDPNYKYPDFKPVRELVPEGVRWALVTRELGNVRQVDCSRGPADELTQGVRPALAPWLGCLQACRQLTGPLEQSVCSALMALRPAGIEPGG
jgi:hypothetical protein